MNDIHQIQKDTCNILALFGIQVHIVTNVFKTRCFPVYSKV